MVNRKNALAVKKVPLYIEGMTKSNAIAAFRDRFRLSQKELAERIGVTARTLRDLEQRRDVPLRYELALDGLKSRLMKELAE